MTGSNEHKPSKQEKHALTWVWSGRKKIMQKWANYANEKIILWHTQQHRENINFLSTIKRRRINSEAEDNHFEIVKGDVPISIWFQQSELRSKIHQLIICQCFWKGLDKISEKMSLNPVQNININFKQLYNCSITKWICAILE